MKWLFWKKSRRLVTVRTLGFQHIRRIPYAHRVVLIKFDDCQCVCRINQFSPSDQVLVIKTGAILPKSFNTIVGVRRKTSKNVVKTLIIRETISDCIIVPIDAIINSKPWISRRLADYIDSITEFADVFNIKYKNPNKLTLRQRFQKIF